MFGANVMPLSSQKCHPNESDLGSLRKQAVHELSVTADLLPKQTHIPPTSSPTRPFHQRNNSHTTRCACLHLHGSTRALHFAIYPGRDPFAAPALLCFRPSFTPPPLYSCLFTTTYGTFHLTGLTKASGHKHHSRLSKSPHDKPLSLSFCKHWAP